MTYDFSCKKDKCTSPPGLLVSEQYGGCIYECLGSTTNCQVTKGDKCSYSSYDDGQFVMAYNTSTDSCKVGCTNGTCGSVQCYSPNIVYAAYYGNCAYECINNYTNCSVTAGQNCTYIYHPEGKYHIIHHTPTGSCEADCVRDSCEPEICGPPIITHTLEDIKQVSAEQLTEFYAYEDLKYGVRTTRGRYSGND